MALPPVPAPPTYVFIALIALLVGLVLLVTLSITAAVLTLPILRLSGYSLVPPWLFASQMESERFVAGVAHVAAGIAVGTTSLVLSLVTGFVVPPHVRFTVIQYSPRLAPVPRLVMATTLVVLVVFAAAMYVRPERDESVPPRERFDEAVAYGRTLLAFEVCLVAVVVMTNAFTLF